MDLEDRLNDPLTTAVVLDIAWPNKGGFELLESIGRSPSCPLAIIVTELDTKTVDSIRRLANAKELKVSVFRKGRTHALKACLQSLQPSNMSFGAQDLSKPSIVNFFASSTSQSSLRFRCLADLRGGGPLRHSASGLRRNPPRSVHRCRRKGRPHRKAHRCRHLPGLSRLANGASKD
jgi:hypothetical protein